MIRTVKGKEKKMLKKKHLYKIIGIISAMMLVLGTLAVPVFAVDTAEYDVQVTTVSSENDVNTISTAQELLELQEDVAALGNGEYLTGTYELTDNINMSSVANQWTGIGVPQSSKGFAGTFDGNGYTIFGIAISNSSNVGPKGALFNLTSGATIKNVTVTGSVTSNRFIGGIVGRTINNATIENCNVNLTLTLNNGASNSIGGIIGQCGSGAGTGGGTGSGGTTGGTIGNVAISNCTVNGTFTSNTSTNPVGGLVGHNYAGYTVNASDCTVRASLNCSGGQIGSVVGKNLGTFTISNCTLSATSSTHTTIPYAGSGTVTVQ